MIDQTTTADTDDTTAEQPQAADLDNYRHVRIRDVPDDTPIVVEAGYEMRHLIAAGLGGIVIAFLVMMAILMTGPDMALALMPEVMI